MKILVTGANGFVGTHLCHKLLSHGHTVYALVRTPDKMTLTHSDLILIQGDLNLSALSWTGKLPDDLDACIHTAGIVHSYIHDEFTQVNVQGTRYLVDSLKIRYSKNLKFILISSLAAAGPVNFGERKDETQIDFPVSQYGRSKKQAEDVLKELLLDLPFGELLVFLFELFRDDVASTRGLGEQHPRDAQRLLHRRIQVARRLLNVFSNVARKVSHPLSEDPEKGHHRDRQQGQPPVQKDHGDEAADDDRDVAHHVGQGRRHHRLHALNVADKPGLDVSRAGGGEELERHPLQVDKEGSPEVAHDLLTDHHSQKSVIEGEQGARDRRRHHPGREGDERGEVLSHDALVDDRLKKQWRHDPQARADENGDEGFHNFARVGSKEVFDAAKDLLVGS